MASVFKRKKTGPWIMQFDDERGRRVQRSSRTTDKRAAQKIAAQLEADAALARNGLKDRSRERRAKAQAVPLQEHLANYFEQCEQAGQAKRHIQNKRSHLNSFVEAIGAAGIGDIEPAALQTHLTKLRKGDTETETRGRAARTVNAVRASVIAFMSWCVKNGFIADNPLLAIPTFDELSDKRRERRALTNDELKRLITVARQQDVANGSRWTPRAVVYTFAALTGLRRGEMRKLCWRDVDLEQSLLIVRASVGKAKRDDVVPLHVDATRALKQLRASETSETGRVFRTLPTIRTVYDDLKRAGIPEQDSSGRWVDLHALRTTLGTTLAKQGVAPQIAQRILRHSDYKTTLRHYTALTIRDSAAAMADVPGVSSTKAEPEESSDSSEGDPQLRHQLAQHETTQDGASACGEAPSTKPTEDSAKPLMAANSRETMRESARTSDRVSAGKASASQAECRRFDSDHPLHSFPLAPKHLGTSPLRANALILF